MKKKPANLHLQIPEPCSQNWEEMIPLPGGRFCHHCEKTVIDFTGMTDKQIASLYKRRQGRVCGLFRQGQLNRSLPLPEPVNRWQRFRAIGALLSGLLLNGVAAAQTAIQKPLAVIQAPVQEADEQSTVEAAGVLKGVVKDETGELLTGASVALFSGDGPGNLGAGTATDEKGRFELKIPAGIQQFWLVFSYVGYEEQAIVPIQAITNPEKDIEVQMKRAAYELPGVEVLAPAMVHVTGLLTGMAVSIQDGNEKGKEAIAVPEEPVSIHKVFPNPFTSHLHVELDQDKPGAVLFHLYDANGKLVFAQAEELPAGKQVTALNLSGRHLPAGAYFLRISDETGEIRTKPLVKAE